ncbi:MAG: hypothetical protein ACK5PG_09575 [Lysobacterales bacterium]
MCSSSSRSAARLWLVLLALATPTAYGQSFSGDNLGAIPDNTGTARSVTFLVSGVQRPLRSVQLSMALEHTWAGDVSATLVSPLGRARLLIFGRTGVQRGATFGTARDLGGTYRFGDSFGTNWWTSAVQATTLMPSGDFRSVTGGNQPSFHGGCPTHMDAVFGGLSAAEVNGQWTLLLTDSVTGDTGSISAATLEIEQAPIAVFRSGFEASEAGSGPGGNPVAPGLPPCQRTYADFDGNGLSDFVLVRAEGSNVRWSVVPNLGGEAVGTETSFLFGGTSDFFFELDYDGDGLSDPAIWVPGAPGRYLVRRSGRPGGPPVEVPLGISGDDPIQAGDYDGDGRDDLALVSRPASGVSGPHLLRIVPSRGGSERSLNLGTGASGSYFVVAGYDYNGDGLADGLTQRADPVTPANGQFQLFSGMDESLLTTFNLGLNSDFLLPGNRLGTRVSDITVRRTIEGTRRHFSRDIAGGSNGAEVIFGVNNDYSLIGDFDGDGIDDYAVWRASTTPGASAFLFLRSSEPALPPREVPMGASGDYPVGSARTR